MVKVLCVSFNIKLRHMDKDVQDPRNEGVVSGAYSHQLVTCQWWGTFKARVDVATC